MILIASSHLRSSPRMGDPGFAARTGFPLSRERTGMFDDALDAPRAALRLHAHEGAGLLRPLGAEIGIFARLQPHRLAGELLVAEEVPGAGRDPHGRDLVLPA